MRRPRLQLLFIAMTLFALMVACNLPDFGNQQVDDVSAVYTMAAQTVQAQLTTAAGSPSTPGAPTTPTQYPTSTLAPTSTPFPTSTPMPTPTPMPDVPNTDAPEPDNGNVGDSGGSNECYRASFVKDVTVKDGTVLDPGEDFTKTWRLKNNGTCTWDEDFELIFVKGDDMNGEDIFIDEDVEPGDEVDLSVNLEAPEEDGIYKGYWMLLSDDGRFGTGTSGSNAIWVEIEVEYDGNVDDDDDAEEVFDFVREYCSADWRSSDGRLDCPGDEDDEQGFVVRLNEPDQENRIENEPALWTYPEMVKDGWISGTYPEFKVKAGDHFLSDVGCLADYPKCDVIFQVKYQINDGEIKTLGEWREVSDGKITRIDLDLSSLADQNIKLILTVLANGTDNDDAAFWLVPHINRP